MKFNCDRTCRTHEAVDLCRFNPMIAPLGALTVNSHTTTVNVHIKSRPALDEAARSLGWHVLGEGLHSLYGANRAQGYGVRLPSGRAAVLRADGQLAFDSMDRHEIGTLTRAYVLAAVRESAGGLGWAVTEETPQSITVRHPMGGKLTVHSSGKLDAEGFCGTDCHATNPIEAALGAVASRTYKPEYYEEPGATQLTMHRS